MKFIELHNGMKAMVDDEDFEYLNQFRWRVRIVKNTCYARISMKINGKAKEMSMHAFIMKTSGRTFLVDHKDGNGLNNCKSNLRICTNQQNCCNRRPAEDGTSKYLGVSFDKSKRKWRAQITVNKRTINLGRFRNEEQAAIAYNKAAIEFHKEFARINKIVA